MLLVKWCHGTVLVVPLVRSVRMYKIDDIIAAFAKILENAGVYKQTDEGKAAFKRFTDKFC